ncbi:MAG: AraC family transcriptional regulator [Pseudomonadota bacterium]
MQTAELRRPEIQALAERLGCEYRAFSPADAKSDDAGEASLFEGYIATQSLPSGIDVIISNIRSLTSGQHVGIVGRSLSIAVALSGDRLDAQFAGLNCPLLSPDFASIARVQHEAELSNTVAPGAGGHTLLIRAVPDRLLDPELAQRLDDVLSTTTIDRLLHSAGTRGQLRELVAPSSSGLVSRLLAESCALDLMARALGNVCSNRDDVATLSTKDRRNIAVAEDYMRTHPAHEHSIAELARIAGMSGTIFKEKFQLATGMTVFAYLRELRLDAAFRLIADEGCSVIEASRFVGYKHQSNFTAAFRRRFGVAPSHLRRTQ